MYSDSPTERERIADILWHSHWRGDREFDHESDNVRGLYLHYADLLIEHGVGFKNGVAKRPPDQIKTTIRGHLEPPEYC